MHEWIVLFSQPNREFLVQSILAAEHIETYLPTVKPAQTRKDRRKEIPFFPRYLFARVDMATVPESSLSWVPGMTSVVKFDGKIARVKQEMIDLIRQRVAQVTDHGYGGLQRGDRVRITSGPLRDIEAAFEKPLSASGRVRILVEILGRLTACEVEYSALERIRKCA